MMMMMMIMLLFKPRTNIASLRCLTKALKYVGPDAASKMRNDSLSPLPDASVHAACKFAILLFYETN